MRWGNTRPPEGGTTNCATPQFGGCAKIRPTWLVFFEVLSEDDAFSVSFPTSGMFVEDKHIKGLVVTSQDGRPARDDNAVA